MSAPAPAGSRRGPSRAVRRAATAALAAELVLGGWLLYRRHTLNSFRGLIDRSTLAERQADLIREAWSELAEQGATYRARLAQGTASIEDARRAILAAAARAGVGADVTPARRSRTRKGVTATPLALSVAGSEEGVLNFLLALDRVPALVSIDEINLAGTMRGQVQLEGKMRHHLIKPRAAQQLLEFVDLLPHLQADSLPLRAYHRPDPLFLPVVAPEEEALRGWPRILVNGFSGDKILITVGGAVKTLTLGMSVTGDIVYAAKISVNEAVLKRKRDNTEVIATVGSPAFSLKPSEIRSMNEFILTLQKRASTDHLAGTGN